MKKNTLSLTLVLAAIAVHADVVDRATAQAAAESFLARDSIGSSVLAGRSVADVVQRGRLWIIALAPSGHIVMSGSDIADPIVGFSKNDFSEPNPRSPAYAVFEGASASMESLEAEGGTRHARWTRLLASNTGRKSIKSPVSPDPRPVIVEPFLPSHYHQDQPYNDYAPVHTASLDGLGMDRGRSPCGCVATAAAQVLSHFKWPARIDTVLTCEHSISNGIVNNSTYTNRFDGNLPLDWESIPHAYLSSHFETITNFYADGRFAWRTEYHSDLRGMLDEAARYSMARLVLWCDTMAQMSFNVNSAGANYETLAGRLSDWYTQGSWVDVGTGTDYSQVLADLQAGMPLHVEIATTGGGHQVVAHGWADDGECKYIYLNFGWGGSDDGYYNLNRANAGVALRRIFVHHYPRAKPQIDPLPKVYAEGAPITLRWHFPDCYTNELVGFQLDIQRVGVGVEEDFIDDFSSSMGTSSSPTDICVSESHLAGDEGLVLSNDYAASGTYEFPTVCTLTSASVLTLKIASYAAISATLEVQMSIDGGQWETVASPPINEGFSSAQWETARVYLGGNGGKTARFRLVKRWGGRYYIDNATDRNRLDYGYVLLDDFKVSSVLKAEMPLTRWVDASCREYTYLRPYDDIQSGASYAFAVRAFVAGALAEGETSDTVMTTVAGTRTKPLPGEESYNTQNLIFATTDDSGVWSYFGNPASVDGVCDDWNPYVGAQCKITADIPGRLTGNSIVTFAYRSGNYYGSGTEYDTITTRFIDEDGTVYDIETLRNIGQIADPRQNNVPLGMYAGRSGKVEVEMVHSGSRYPGTCVVEGVQLLNVAVRSTPDVTWGSDTVTAHGMPTINAIEHSGAPIADGLFAECSMGINTFSVSCSDAVVSLEAHVSAASFVPDSAVDVQNLGNGSFAVHVDASGIPAWAERTRAILTLAAANADGSTAYRDVSLRFSSQPPSEFFLIDNDGVLTDVKAPLAITDAVIPATVTQIGRNAFHGCSNLLSVTIPGSVRSIGEFAFEGCVSLASVTISDNVTNIANYAFAMCPAITNATIGSGVEAIGEGAFWQCSGLQGITIPSSVKSIGNYAFKDCGHLQYAVFEGNAPVMGDAVFLGDSIDCTAYVGRNSTGWGVAHIPAENWHGIQLAYSDSGEGISVGDKGTIEESADGTGYNVTASDGLSISESDFDFGQLPRTAYQIVIAPGGATATVTLKPPVVGAEAAAPTAAKDSDDPSGMLVDVPPTLISAPPATSGSQAVGAMPVQSYSGLYYQAAWGTEPGNLSQGEKVPGDGGTLYLGVIKQTGPKGFYKLTVTDR